MRPALIAFASAGPKRHLMAGDKERARLVPEQILCAIAVMHIEIHHSNAVQPMPFHRVARCDCNCAEQAKAHRCRGFGVMTGRTHRDESVPDCTCQHQIYGSTGPADSALRRIQRTGGDMRVGIKLIYPCRRDRLANAVDIVLGMAQQELVLIAERRLVALERSKLGGCERLGYGVHAGDLLGVPGRCFMPMRVRVGQQCSCHGVKLLDWPGRGKSDFLQSEACGSAGAMAVSAHSMRKTTMQTEKSLSLLTPEPVEHRFFTDPDKAVARLEQLYASATKFLIEAFNRAASGERTAARFRSYYPEIRFVTSRYDQIDSRLSFGHVAEPGTYATTVTRPDLFRHYLRQQISLLIQNHNVPVSIGPSSTPIPLHFAMAGRGDVQLPENGDLTLSLRDLFDVPDLATTNDDIVNGERLRNDDGSLPLALFSAQRVDYSLARLAHYTATAPEHFQNHILFTNYQFYVDEFEAYARAQLRDPESGYSAFVAPGDTIITDPDAPIPPLSRLPQMPTYHLKRHRGAGITLVNIGVGPSNAKTATDHIAVLRPHAWLMVGHCAGLRNSQALGDFVLAHAYLREDNVLDADLPVWVPIPALAEIQIALQDAVAEITQLEGFALKRIMRTGTVATIDNRNWELRDQSGPVQRLSQSRAIALDMESATIAANGFRFRVPYGTLLCVSDKPLHGELKLPGMASSFYRSQVSRHLQIGIRAMELLRDMPMEKIHSRKLRSFSETAFL